MRKHAWMPFVLLSCLWPAVGGLSAAERSINVSVDPRIELLAAVQLLSGYGEQTGLITRFDFPYKRAVAEHFAPYKDHPAVKRFREMSGRGFSFDAPPETMLHLSNPPDLAVQEPFTDYLNRRAGGERQLQTFVGQLRDFARKTDFMTFFDDHKAEFEAMAADVRGKMAGSDWVGVLEDYYGMKQNSYNIVLAPLFHGGGFGCRVERAKGSYDVYNICGPGGVENGLPVFGTRESFQYLAWHEFSHSFVNPTTEKFRKEIGRYSRLYNPISEAMKKQAYPQWEICVNEHIVRAVTVRLACRVNGQEAGDEALARERGNGFFYVGALCERLKEYEGRRDKYPSLADFYPRLVDVFRELSEKKLGADFYTMPFAGPINAAVMDKKSVILIVPTGEADKAVQDRIHAHAKTMRDRFFRGAPVLTDTEAAQQDLSQSTLIVYGTPSGNLWLAQQMDKLPVRIEPNRIVADTAYPGAHLRFLTAWPNPQNPQKGMVVYTAQQAEDIVDINSVFHGPTDYVIANGVEVLKAGNYKKRDGKWTFR